jgi:diguanylate cyclase (GGDEF)-like protein
MGSLNFDSEVMASIPEAVTYLSVAANVALGGLGLYLHNRKRREHYKATHDKLTGLLNVQGLEELLETNAPPQALLYVDTTNLKSVNDRLGHSAGNKALVGTTDIIKTILRESDVAARVGGDEFLVLLNQDRREERADGETPMEPEELLDVVMSRFNEGTVSFLDENPDLRAAGLNIAVGGVVSQLGMTSDQLTDAAEKNMYVHKALQHEAVGSYR